MMPIMPNASETSRFPGSPYWSEKVPSQFSGDGFLPLSLTYFCDLGPRGVLSYDPTIRRANLSHRRRRPIKVSLGTIEGLLLEMFICSPFQVYSVDEIQDHPSFLTYSNRLTAIDQAISHINRKLRPEGLDKEGKKEARVICSVPRRGFTLLPHLSQEQLALILQLPPGEDLPRVLKTPTAHGELLSIPKRNLVSPPHKNEFFKVDHFESCILEILQLSPTGIFSRGELASIFSTSKESVSVAISRLRKILGDKKVRLPNGMEMYLYIHQVNRPEIRGYSLTKPYH